MDENMSLAEYIAEQRKLIDSFEAHWKEKQVSEPDNYPSTMHPVDWDEQLRAYESLFAE